MHPSDRAALAAKVGEVIDLAYLKSAHLLGDPQDILDTIADAVMEIIEPVANERDELKAKLAAADDAIRSLYRRLSFTQQVRVDRFKFPAVQRAKEAKP